MEVSLNLKGPPRAVLLTPYPDDPQGAVQAFRAAFKSALRTKVVLVGEEETRSWTELCTAFKCLPKKYPDYNCLLILSHGTPNHRLAIQDPDFPLPAALDKVEFLGNLVGWSSWFRSAFDDKLLLFAACYSGDTLNTDPLLHTGMALHVVAPDPANPTLKVNAGAASMALFLDHLASKSKSTYTPGDLADAESSVNAKHPNTLKLWPYEADPEFVEHMSRELLKWLVEEGGGTE